MMDKKIRKMNTKNTLVSFLLIASVLFLASAVSALGTNQENVQVNNIAVVNGGYSTNTVVSINAGDTITVQVAFNATVDATNVRIKATLEGNSNDVMVVTPNFDVIKGNTYVQTLTLKVPSDFQDNNLNENLPLDIQILDSNGYVDTEYSSIPLTVQRPSYDLAIESVNVDNTVSAGQSVPVSFTVKNVGYNNADDVYVTLSIPELNIQKTVYLGDLVTQNFEDYNASDNNNDQVTASGTVNLDIPYNASGDYTLTIQAGNDQEVSTATQVITVNNNVPNIAIQSGNDLTLLNPTNQLAVYTVKYNSTQQTVVVPAESSSNVPITVPTSGTYQFDVSVYSGDTLLSTVNYSGSNPSTATLTNPVFVLTGILAIIFLVLLVVLVVLITKKPQKTEEFGESYY